MFVHQVEEKVQKTECMVEMIILKWLGLSKLKEENYTEPEKEKKMYRSLESWHIRGERDSRKSSGHTVLIKMLVCWVLPSTGGD